MQSSTLVKYDDLRTYAVLLQAFFLKAKINYKNSL